MCLLANTSEVVDHGISIMFNFLANVVLFFDLSATSETGCTEQSRQRVN